MRFRTARPLKRNSRCRRRCFDTHTAAPQLGWIIRHAEDIAVIVDAVLLPVFAKISTEQLKLIRTVIVCGEDDRPGGWAHTEPAAELRGKVPLLVDWDDFLRESMVSTPMHHLERVIRFFLH